MGLRGRLRKLEEGRKELPCAGCGLRPGGTGYIVYEIPDGKPERCGVCGRRMWFVIEVNQVGGEG